MPFTNSFAQSYLSWQENPNKLFEDNPPTNTQTSPSPDFYDPLATAPRDLLIAVPSTFGNLSAYTDTDYVYASDTRSTLDRVLVPYSVVFIPWDGTKTQFQYTPDDAVFLNTTGSTAIIACVDLIHCPIITTAGTLDTDFPETITFTREANDPNYAAVYSTVEPITFPQSSYVISQVSNQTYRCLNPDPQQSRFYTDGVIDNKAVGETLSVNNAGTLTLARYNFEQSIALDPNESITVDFGTITLTYTTEVITC